MVQTVHCRPHGAHFDTECMKRRSDLEVCRVKRLHADRLVVRPLQLAIGPTAMHMHLAVNLTQQK